MRVLIVLFLFIHSFLLQAQKDTTKLNVAIFLYPGVELLDFAGPLEVLANAKDMQVFTVASDTGKLYSMRKSLTILPDYNFKTVPKVDILVIPGAGEFLMTAVNKSENIAWINSVYATSKMAMSICTGAAFFCQSGNLRWEKSDYALGCNPYVAGVCS